MDALHFCDVALALVLYFFCNLFYSLVLRMLSLHRGPPSNNISMLCIRYIYRRIDNEATLNLALALVVTYVVGLTIKLP